MMNVLFCSNDHTYSGLELAIYTLLTHNKYCNIYIFTMDCDIRNDAEGYGIKYKALTDQQRKRLTKIVDYVSGGQSNLCIKDVYDLYIHYLDQSVNRYTRFTPYAALRLVADIALPYVNELWYFDCDVAVNGNIESYYDTYIRKHCTYGAYVTPDVCDGRGEMITGVMFMNLAVMREQDFLKQARFNYNHNLYNYPDQCAIRDAGSPEIFPPTLGYCEELENCLELPLIVHFTNKISPKIYMAKNKETFYRKFNFLNYVKEGLALINTINHN